MKEELIKKITSFVHPNEDINLSGTPATLEEIANAEEILNVKFHDDYRDFILEFGGAYAGISVYAFKNNEMLSEETIIDVTKTFREDYSEDYRSGIINKSYVISFDDMGNPILIDEDGKVIIFYHDSDEYEVITDSLSELIEGLLDGKDLYDFNES